MANAAYTIGIPEYDGTTDPEDFVKAFRKAANMLRWEDPEALNALTTSKAMQSRPSTSCNNQSKKHGRQRAQVTSHRVCAEQYNTSFQLPQAPPDHRGIDRLVR